MINALDKLYIKSKHEFPAFPLRCNNAMSYLRRPLGAFAKLRKASVNVLTVCPHGTTGLTLDGSV